MFSSPLIINKRLISTTLRLAEQKGSKAIISSCPAGTPLNLQIKKTGKEPVALHESEYPEWLWGVLDPQVEAAKLNEDPFAARKKQLRKMNREKIKQNNFLSRI
ncbi:mitochondrial 54S ribosomal protein mL54 Ecym_6289 [Eremothecium cymbalariae DBVPG|uniref:Large ribosomal subunit protein mL54 n=1 Tax=Eremothecium cymbalariae (strain CBS 270.75 / DBVPG 7215 / KCTC 17166 / NRRL Y-17582) TaxID=931890 RepID=G8JVJ0_ERECY|nr:hypothetical protein Ecym_6289 [Eremothecium cymbalariae DBVPG\